MACDGQMPFNPILSLCLLCLPCLALASPESERLQSFSAERLTHAKVEAEARYLDCTAPGAPVLSADTFEGLALSDEEKKLALLYFHARARRACTERTDTARYRRGRPGCRSTPGPMTRMQNGSPQPLPSCTANRNTRRVTGRCQNPSERSWSESTHCNDASTSSRPPVRSACRCRRQPAERFSAI